MTVQSTDTMHATLNWGFEGTPDHFEAEYGAQGFTPGNGTPVSVTTNHLALSDLQPGTYYDVYVRCVCDSTLAGEWAMVNFRTDTLGSPGDNDTTGIQTYRADNLLVYPNPAKGHCTVRFAHEMPKVVRLYSIDGKLLRQLIPDKETMELSLPTPGIFLLQCEMETGTATHKIINQ